MPLARCAIAIAITLAACISNPTRAAAQAEVPSSCQVTLPLKTATMPSDPVAPTRVGIGADGLVAVYGTEKLWTRLPVNGIWRGTIPQKPAEFAYSNKLPWGGTFSYKDGPLMVTGKRLDGPAPKFTEIEPISWERAFMGGINIPVFGCWEITGQYRDQQLRFVIWVAPMAEPQASSTDISQEPPAAAAPRKIHVDGDVEANFLWYRVAPEVPHEAQVANISGTVVLHATIGTDGRPHNLQYVSGPRLLAQAAVDSASWWQYQIDELETEIDTTIPVVFAAGQ